MRETLLSLLPLSLIGLYIVAIVVPGWKVFTKAGYPGAMSLLLLIPIVHAAVWCYFGFSDWPVLKELRALRNR